MTEHVFRLKESSYELHCDQDDRGVLIELNIDESIIDWLDKNTMHIGVLVTFMVRPRTPFSIFEPYEVIAIIPSVEDEVDEEAILFGMKFSS